MNYLIECELPNGRKVKSSFTGYVESDTNAFIVNEDNQTFYWSDTDDELTQEELETEFEVTLTRMQGTVKFPYKLFLHEYVMEFGEYQD